MPEVLTMIEKVKNALLISTDDFDDELNDLIDGAVMDLGIAGVDNSTVVTTSSTNSLVIRAICSYCGYHFELEHGALNRADAFKRSYDEQKAQLGMNATYTSYTT